MHTYTCTHLMISQSVTELADSQGIYSIVHLVKLKDSISGHLLRHLLLKSNDWMEPLPSIPLANNVCYSRAYNTLNSLDLGHILVCCFYQNNSACSTDPAHAGNSKCPLNRAGSMS